MNKYMLKYLETIDKNPNKIVIHKDIIEETKNIDEKYFKNTEFIILSKAKINNDTVVLISYPLIIDQEADKESVLPYELPEDCCYIGIHKHPYPWVYIAKQDLVYTTTYPVFGLVMYCNGYITDAYIGDNKIEQKNIYIIDSYNLERLNNVKMRRLK